MDYKHFINGSISGMFGVILSHPIDTIKTSIQDNKKVNLNARYLYRGILPALSGVGLEKAVVFGFYNNSYYYCSKYFNDFYAIPISGLMSGIGASLVVTPVERLKILSQTGHKLELKYFHPSSLYRGITATFTREVPGFAIYFSNYNYWKNKLYGDSIPLHMSFLLGGLSGALSWLFIYPQDVVKTRMQAHNHTNNSFLNTVSTLYKEGGYRVFVKGFHFALLRAIPLHAGTFMMMEVMSQLF